MNSRVAGREAIEAGQLARLRALLPALRDNPFYRSRLEPAGLLGEVTSLHDFTSRCPFTTKPQCVEDQRLHPPFGSNLTYPLVRYTRFHSTSGTTAAPMRWLDTPESWQWMLDNWKSVFHAAGVTADDRVFFAFSFGPFLGFWTAFEAATQLGLLCLPGGGLGSEARLNMVLDNPVTVLCCTPTYALRLGESAAHLGIDPSRSAVRTIVVAGESGGSVPAVRGRIEALWPGARVFDHHGMTEVGPVSHECPARPGTLRVLESSYIAEVIDPVSGDPVREEVRGELVLTTLGRTGSPLLRYRTGDLVRPVYLNDAGDGPGPCLSLEGGILGRVDDMVVVRGVNIHPSAVDQLMWSDPAVGEYRVEVSTTSSMTEMKVLVEPGGGASGDGLTARLESALRAAFSLRIPVEIVPGGSLGRPEMKAKRWIRK